MSVRELLNAWNAKRKLLLVLAIAGAIAARSSSLQENIVAKAMEKPAQQALTQRLLCDAQRYYFLYADKKNASSNRMYEAIGYELLGETQNYRFEKAD